MKVVDNLEQYIANHRTAFDTDTPSVRVWEGIQNRLLDEDILEKFIKKNRSEFDGEIPNLQLWSAIENQINPIKEYKIVQISWFRQAAAAIALLIVGAGLGIFYNEKAEVKALSQVTSDIAPDLKEAESYYTKKVEVKYSALVNHNPDPAVITDLKQIDDVQKELKKELENAPATAREEIVRRMIENYQIKLGILERVLNHIEEHPDNQKIQQNEKI